MSVDVNKDHMISKWRRSLVCKYVWWLECSSLAV